MWTMSNSTREVIDIFNSELYYQVTISGREEYNIGSVW